DFVFSGFLFRLERWLSFDCSFASRTQVSQFWRPTMVAYDVTLPFTERKAGWYRTGRRMSAPSGTDPLPFRNVSQRDKWGSGCFHAGIVSTAANSTMRCLQDFRQSAG